MATLAVAFNGAFRGPLVRRRAGLDRLLTGLLTVFLFLFLTIFSAACSFGVDQALSDIDLILQTGTVVCGAIGVIAPGDSVACQGIAAVGIAGVTVIKTAYDAYEANKTASTLANLQGALAQIKANLPDALRAAHVVDPNVMIVVTNWVNFVIATVDEVISLIPKLLVKGTTAQVWRVAAAFPTPEVLHARWTTEVCRGNLTCGGLVKVHHVHGRAEHWLSLGVLR